MGILICKNPVPFKKHNTTHTCLYSINLYNISIRSRLCKDVSSPVHIIIHAKRRDTRWETKRIPYQHVCLCVQTRVRCAEHSMLIYPRPSSHINANVRVWFTHKSSDFILPARAKGSDVIAALRAVSRNRKADDASFRNRARPSVCRYEPARGRRFIFLSSMCPRAPVPLSLAATEKYEYTSIS